MTKIVRMLYPHLSKLRKCSSPITKRDLEKLKNLAMKEYERVVNGFGGKYSCFKDKLKLIVLAERGQLNMWIFIPSLQISVMQVSGCFLKSAIILRFLFQSEEIFLKKRMVCFFLMQEFWI